MNRVCVEYNAEHPEKSIYMDIPLDEWDGYDDKQAYFADKEQARYDYECKLRRAEPIDKISFRNDEHKETYIFYLSLMKHLDCYHRSLAYLFALDSVLRDHIEDVFDFQEDGIKREGLHKGFQTETSMKTTRLAFNLWNGYCSDGEKYKDEKGYTVDLPSGCYTPEHIFSCIYAKYYWQAIKLRYPEYTKNRETDFIANSTM